MNLGSPRVATFKWCIPAVAAITLLALLPQLHFWLMRGSQWHGAYAVVQPDELFYSAYINALIDGRPRRNDPFSGRDDHPKAPLPESVLFIHSIVPAYIVAFVARQFGASASTAFIVLTIGAAFLTSVSVFWLLASAMGDTRFAALGVLIVLCFGAFAGGQGLIGLFFKTDLKFLGLPFLRRYEPAAPFPLVFVFCTLIWQALTSGFRRCAPIKALLAGVAFGLLVFSYFYLWTAVFAWFVCFACLWLVMRPADRRKSIGIILIVSAAAILSLSLYAYLLSHLRASLDSPTVLTLTRFPDLLRVPEIIGGLLLVALIIGICRRRISAKEPQVILAVSFVLLPFLVFNQQLLSGRSIQPFHYEILIANYMVLVGLVLVSRLLQPVMSRRLVILVAASCIFWGTLEVSFALRARYSANVSNDEMVPVLRRLNAQAKHDGTWEELRTKGKAPSRVFSPDYRFAALLSTWTPQGALLATGQGLSEANPKEQLYTHFYYSGATKEYVRELLNDRTGEGYANYYARTTIFGPERGVGFLNEGFQPIRQDEIEQEVAAYDAFASSFSRDEALQLQLGYAVTPSDGQFDFSHIDLWYERDTGIRVEAYTLYRLKLRDY
jgi:hypothetical protein